MPCREIVMKMSGDFCSPEWLKENLRAGEKVLLIDCRPQNDYVRSHVQGAINVSLPNLMLRRLKKGNLKISCLIQNNEAKDTFNRVWKSHKIVIYDECTTDPNSNPSNVVDLLMKKLRQDGASVSCLEGLCFIDNYKPNISCNVEIRFLIRTRLSSHLLFYGPIIF